MPGVRSIREMPPMDDTSFAEQREYRLAATALRMI